jgi:putative ABC transport system permease protein
MIGSGDGTMAEFIIYGALGILVALSVLGLALLLFLVLLYLILSGLRIALPSRTPRFFLTMLQRSIVRNFLRTWLTSAALFVLVMLATGVWSILSFLDQVTAEKAKDLKALVSEKHQFPSMMPFAYAASLAREAQTLPEDLRPREEDFMTWQFYVGTLDPAKRTRENFILSIALEPRKLRTMMPELENLDERLVQEMEATPQAVVIGRQRLEAMNKRVGERFRVTSLNYEGIDLEFEIAGKFPEGRYDQSAVMHRDYLNRALEAYERKHGLKHDLTGKSLSLFWMRLPTRPAFERVAGRIMETGKFSDPAVKCETEASGIAASLDAYRHVIWGMRWLLSPAILITMCLVVAVTININVHERYMEMAVLKVLSFGPGEIMVLVVGEAVLLGASVGLFSAGLMYVLVNQGTGGLKFPVAYFPSFMIPVSALWWGPLLGAATAGLGSLVPAWFACRVRVAQVFARVA